jgi:predicted kinase
MKPVKPIDIDSISPERRRIAKIFKAHIEKAINELGAGYSVTLQGKFDATPIRIEIEVAAQKGELP